ncbi:hypothetical protein Tco_1071671 [Tanacetum coccineum]
MHTRSQTRNLHNQQHQVPPPVEQFNLEEPLENPPPPLAPMDDQRTMAQLLEAPTAGYEDAIVVPEITADNFELKARLLTSFQNKQFFTDKEDTSCHIQIFSKQDHFYDEVPRTPEKIISPLLLSKLEKVVVLAWCVISYQTYPATAGNVYRDNIQEYVSQAAAANYNQGNTGYRAPISNQIRPPGFPPVQNNHVQNHGNNQNRYNQNRGNFNQAPAYQPPVNQGQIYRPQVVQPPAYQAPAYQAPAPQTQGVLVTDIKKTTK